MTAIRCLLHSFHAGFGKDLPYCSMDTTPLDGMCLSLFLELSKGDESNLLMGRVNPKCDDWAHIGSLDEPRLQRFSNGWMLPLRHLLLIRRFSAHQVRHVVSEDRCWGDYEPYVKFGSTSRAKSSIRSSSRTLVAKLSTWYFTPASL